MIGILITTFLRDKLLFKCLNSIKKHFSDDLYVIVVDNGKQSNDKDYYFNECFKDIKGEYIVTEFDIGPLKSRNIAIKRFAELKISYVLMFADSMFFLQKYDFKPIIEFLEQDEKNFLCGFNRENSICTWECDMKKTNCFELDIPRRPIIDYKGLKFQPVDLCRNVFLCKTNMLVNSLYDEDRKLCDHESSFYRWKENSYKCYYYNEITFGYTRERNLEYKGYRDRFVSEKRKMCEKYGLKKWVSYSLELSLKWKKEKFDKP